MNLLDMHPVRYSIYQEFAQKHDKLLNFDLVGNLTSPEKIEKAVLSSMKKTILEMAFPKGDVIRSYLNEYDFTCERRNDFSYQKPISYVSVDFSGENSFPRSPRDAQVALSLNDAIVNDFNANDIRENLCLQIIDHLFASDLGREHMHAIDMANLYLDNTNPNLFFYDLVSKEYAKKLSKNYEDLKGINDIVEIMMPEEIYDFIAHKSEAKDYTPYNMLEKSNGRFFESIFNDKGSRSNNLER